MQMAPDSHPKFEVPSNQPTSSLDNLHLRHPQLIPDLKD